MNDLQLTSVDDHAVELRTAAGALLLRYVVRPETPANEASRPFAHPICSLAGETLTNFRPSDHSWHHGLSFTINNLSGWNFWGGPTYRQGRGYQWQENHGEQRHLGWLARTPELIAHRVDWLAEGAVFLHEERRLSARIESPRAWSLRWSARLRNVSGHPLVCANYHSGDGLVGSHYTGLQFRGARDLLDDHGDDSIAIVAAGGLAGETRVHGAAAEWMEWRGQKDGSLRRVAIRFANARGPLHWFVRRHNPLAAFPFHFDRNLEIAPDAAFEIDHTLTFTDA